MKYKIPKCPDCGKEITEVRETTDDKYFFNKKTGIYESPGNFGFGFGGELSLSCVNCGAFLEAIFEEGVCNYQALKSVKVKKEKK